MSDKLTVIHQPGQDGSTPNPVDLQLGQWYWVTSTCRFDGDPVGCKEGDAYEWLACVMQIGSNFVELHSPHGGQSYTTKRVHFNDFWEVLRFEPNASAAINERIAHYQQESARLMNEVQKVTSRLGLTPMGELAAPQAPADSSRALVTLSGQVDIKSYERALVVAKEETLPNLFKQIKEAHRHLATWMQATTMTMKAQMGPMEDSIEEINDRIFNVGLYSGLTEDAVKCSDGKPAAMSEKLHVMQRRLYMDEECLLDYQAGGMEFKDIEKFDDWISRPNNRDRILPFPRTMVAMRVRRNTKERESGGDLLSAFINMQIARGDKATFLYIRNGEQVWRIACEMDFGEMLFPDASMFDPHEPKMVKMFANRVDKMMSVSEFEQRKAEYDARESKCRQWEQENPGAHWIDNPHRNYGSFDPRQWAPFDQSNVYFDECMAEVAKRIKEYNRVALIIQGLFDRSEALHPHPKVQSWTQEGFAAAITLIYDGSGVLSYGAAPDFEAFRARCNASLSADSVVTGQQDYWLRREGDKESRRRDADWRYRDSNDRPKRYQPRGNDGPGVVAHMMHWKARSREAVFAWHRERQTDVDFGPGRGDPIRTTLTVPEAELFNISAYTPGDHMQFFQDPRTRAEYLKWAPILLVAEDYHAGKVQPKQPVAE